MTTTAPTAPTTVETLRTIPPGKCHPEWFYCPACRCRKSGDAQEPNRRDESCLDESCLCHRDAACQCCDGVDGLGYYHFDTIEQLRAFLATPGHETTRDIDVATVPDEPYGLGFVTAGDAAAWLEEYDERNRAANAYDRRPIGHR